jgi:hypothetical protein
MKGLLVFVLRGTSDCTNGGITSICDKFILCGEGIPEIFEPSPETPALRLVKRNIGGDYYHAEPVVQPKGLCGPMAGGNYITTSDSRMPVRYPISVHDRFETAQMNELLSR